MKTKAHEPSKANVNNTGFNRNLSDYFSESRTTVVDRVVETYRGIIKYATPETTFEATIDALVALGYFSSLKTKTELRVLFETRIREVTI
jgi:hypothetical protein